MENTSEKVSNMQKTKAKSNKRHQEGIYCHDNDQLDRWQQCTTTNVLLQVL